VLTGVRPLFGFPRQCATLLGDGLCPFRQALTMARGGSCC